MQVRTLCHWDNNEVWVTTMGNGRARHAALAVGGKQPVSVGEYPQIGWSYGCLSYAVRGVWGKYGIIKAYQTVSIADSLL